MPAQLALALAILCEVAATSALKASNEFNRPLPSAIVVAGYAGAFYFLSVALRTIPLGIAYAIWSAVGIVMIAAIGWIAYGQALDTWRVVGIALIVAGVIVVQLAPSATQ